MVLESCHFNQKISRITVHERRVSGTAFVLLETYLLTVRWTALSSPMQSRHQHQDKHAVLRANVCRDPWTTNSASMFLRWHDTSLGASMWDLLTRAGIHGL